jgi:hypothetical protein
MRHSALFTSANWSRAKRQGVEGQGFQRCHKTTARSATCAPLLSQHVVEFFALETTFPFADLRARALDARRDSYDNRPDNVSEAFRDSEIAAHRNRLLGPVLGIRGVRQETRSTTSGVADASQ